MYHSNVNVNLMAESVIKIKSGIILNVNVSLKSIKYVKNILFGILIHAVGEMVNI